jgi:hypothetical protein
MSGTTKLKGPLDMEQNRITDLPAPGAGSDPATKTSSDAAAAAAQAAAIAASQPLDSDLTAIAALSTTSFGRGLLALANGAALLSSAGAAAAVHTHAESDITGLVADLAAKQPIDSDLTAIAALATTSYGRSLLTQADAAAAQATLGVYSTATVDAFFQPLDADLTAIAALSTTATGRSLLAASNAAAIRTIADSQQLDSDLTAIAALSPSNDDVVQRKAGAWTNRSMAQVKSDLALVKGDVGLGNVDNVQQQPIDSDLTVIAGLTPTTDNFMQAKSSAWASRTIAQVKTDLGISNVDNTTDLNKPVSTLQATADLAVEVKALARWVPIFDAHVNLSAAAAGVYPAHRTVTEDQLIGAASPAGYNVAFMFLDPADYAIAGYTLKYRVIASFSQNAVANAGTSVATAGLYPYVGAGATTTWLATLGAVIGGSTAARTGGAASSEARVISTTFTAPAADTYALAVAITTATTAGSTRINVRLEYSYA